MRKLGSILLTAFVCGIIVACLLLSLDLIGVIKLPSNFSLKKVLTSVGTLGKGEEVYYPDYDATGLSAENKVTREEKIKEIQGQTAENTELDQELIKQVMEDVNSGNADTEIVDQNYNVTDNSYFYTQLDTYGKTFYSRIFSNIENLKSGTYTIDFGTTFNDLLHTDNGEQILTNAFQLSINALLLDHPEIFYLDVTKLFMFTETTTNFSGTTYKISIGPDKNTSYLLDGFNGAEDVIYAEENIKSQLNEIARGLSGSVYNKILQVHNYLIDNTVYDESTIELDASHTLYGTFINKVAVCDGYAKAFKYILDSVGISCVEVCGIAQNSAGESESHAWNYVLLDGKWYAIDVTWDDPILVGGNGILPNDLRYSYFLKGSDTFYATHQEDGYVVTNGEFKYPEISTTAYN